MRINASSLELYNDRIATGIEMSPQYLFIKIKKNPNEGVHRIQMMKSANSAMYHRIS